MDAALSDIINFENVMPSDEEGGAEQPEVEGEGEEDEAGTDLDSPEARWEILLWFREQFEERRAKEIKEARARGDPTAPTEEQELAEQKELDELL